MKQANPTFKTCLILCLLSLLLACSNKATLNSANSALDIAYQQIVRSNHPYTNNSILEIKVSLSIFEQYDDINGQWLANYHIANYWTSFNKYNKALKFSIKARELAEIMQQTKALFKSTFQVAQLTKNAVLMQKSLEYTSNVVERALVLTHLDRNQQAYDLISAEIDSSNPEQYNTLAFILFQYAKKYNIETLIKRSKYFYIKAGNGNGVVDCLFLLAKYNFNKQDLLLAKQFSNRAMTASSAINNVYKSEKIKLWIDNHL